MFRCFKNIEVIYSICHVQYGDILHIIIETSFHRYPRSDVDLLKHKNHTSMAQLLSYKDLREKAEDLRQRNRTDSAKFLLGQLSELVLVDIMAALPMKQVMRLTRLGSPRLRQTCSLRWVTLRMTDVKFGEIARADSAGGDLADVFTAEWILKRLNGVIHLEPAHFICVQVMKCCLALINRIPGKLFLYFLYQLESSRRGVSNLQPFFDFLDSHDNIKYIHENAFSRVYGYQFMRFPNIIFCSAWIHNTWLQQVLYRPSRLNGRHIVDVLRAVGEATDVDEACLDSARRQAKNNARSIVKLNDCCFTNWTQKSAKKRHRVI